MFHEVFNGFIGGGGGLTFAMNSFQFLCGEESPRFSKRTFFGREGAA